MTVLALIEFSLEFHNAHYPEGRPSCRRDLTSDEQRAREGCGRVCRDTSAYEIAEWLFPALRRIFFTVCNDPRRESVSPFSSWPGFAFSRPASAHSRRFA